MRDIPFILQRLPPPSWEWANLGSQEYGQNVLAVVVGGGYNDSEFERLRAASEGKSRVPWLRHDVTRDIDPRRPRPKVGIEYGEQLATRIVDALRELEKSGKMDADGIYWF